MGAAELPEPIAEGTLASRPFAHLLLYVQQQRMNGTLVIWPEQGPGTPNTKGQDRVRFVEGKPRAGRFVQRGSSLDRSMLPLFTRVNAPYAFYERDLVGSGEGVLEGNVEPLVLITASLRGAARDDAIDNVMRRLGAMSLRIRTGANLDSLGLAAKEKQFVDLIRADPNNAAVLIEESGNERMARRLIYLLTITRNIEPFTPQQDNGREATGEFGAVSVPPGAITGRHRAVTGPHEVRTSTRPRSISNGPPSRRSTRPSSNSSRPSVRPSSRPSSRPSGRPRRMSSGHGLNNEGHLELAPPPPQELSDEHAQRWRDVANFSEKIDTLNFFEMLGVDQKASDQQVRDAYFSLAKQWHPDRLPPELMPMRAYADLIFFHLTKAKDTLSDNKLRTDYTKQVAAGGGTPESDRRVNNIIEAAMAMQRADVHLKRNDWETALGLAEEAMELNGDDGDAMAMTAWCLFQLQRGEGPYEDILSLLDRSLQMNDNSEKAHFYRGMVYKRQGEDKKALREFRAVIHVNPRHTEAMREVRIYNMRKRKKGDGGFLSKLFGSSDDKK